VRLYKHFGYLVLEDLFASHFIDQLNNYFSGKYAKYYEDRMYGDALRVGNRRHMVTVALEGKFNTPELYANTFVMPILYRLLHKDLILYSLGAVVSLPGAKLQHTHRDNYSLFEIDGLDNILPSYAITLGVPLIDMNDTTGTTRFYGTTHRRHGWLLSEQERQKGIKPDIRKGSCVLFDYMVFHEGTPNNSDKVRPLIYNIYTRPWFRDIANYNKQKPLNISDEELLKIPDQYRYLLQQKH
jgi:ectoine hydroxylase-related dioxygenase (phytanoyl-CoA dioxygenase family)